MFAAAEDPDHIDTRLYINTNTLHCTSQNNPDILQMPSSALNDVNNLKLWLAFVPVTRQTPESLHQYKAAISGAKYTSTSLNTAVFCDPPNKDVCCRPLGKSSYARPNLLLAVCRSPAPNVWLSGPAMPPITGACIIIHVFLQQMSVLHSRSVAHILTVQHQGPVFWTTLAQTMQCTCCSPITNSAHPINCVTI